MAQKLILDADPGRDDAVAFMLAALSPEIELLGVSCAVMPYSVVQRRRGSVSFMYAGMEWAERLSPEQGCAA